MDEELEPINSDLKIELEGSMEYRDYDKEHYNVFIKNEIQEKKDYILINQELWDYFMKISPDGIEIKRKAYRDKFNNKQVEVVLKLVLSFSNQLIL